MNEINMQTAIINYLTIYVSLLTLLKHYVRFVLKGFIEKINFKALKSIKYDDIGGRSIALEHLHIKIFFMIFFKICRWIANKQQILVFSFCTNERNYQQETSSSIILRVFLRIQCFNWVASPTSLFADVARLLLAGVWQC